MKIAKTIAFLFLYLLSCLSIVVDFHFCGSDMVKVALYHADEDGCCGEHEEDKQDCCHDEFVYLDTDDTDHPKKPFVKTPDSKLSIAPIQQLENILLFIPNEQAFIPPSHAPPDDHPKDLYLQNRVLLI